MTPGTRWIAEFLAHSALARQRGPLPDFEQLLGIASGPGSGPSLSGVRFE
jgi:hypothetical protein